MVRKETMYNYIGHKVRPTCICNECCSMLVDDEQGNRNINIKLDK